MISKLYELVLKFILKRYGYINQKVSQDLYKEKLMYSLNSCGIRLSIQHPIIITDMEQVTLGDDVSLAAYVHIWGGGNVLIGDRVMIGTHTSISSLTHDYAVKAMYLSLVKKKVVIGSDVWIGSNCVILPGVNVGEGAVIGAGSVVTKDVFPFDIVVGVPAKTISKRYPIIKIEGPEFN